MKTAAARVLEAVAKAGLRVATLNDSPQEAYDVLWSVVTRVEGKRLAVAASRDPSTFAAMEYERTATISLAGKSSVSAVVSILRQAAAEMPLPQDARAVPFSLLTGGGANSTATKRICAVAVPHRPFAPTAVVWGSRRGAVVAEAVAVTEDELVSVVIDQFKDFGRVSNRVALSDLTRADLDPSMLTVAPRIGPPLSWTLDHTPRDDFAALLAAFQRRQVPLRRLVQVDPSTREWRALDA